MHAADTLHTGGGIADNAHVDTLTQAGPGAMHWVFDAGFPPDRNPDRGIALAREGAHSRPRVVHAGGDATGKSLVAALADRVRATPSIRLMPSTMALELIRTKGRVTGVRAYRRGVGMVAVPAAAVVLATGGTGMLWSETTNPAEATGDGLALAARAGAVLGDLEFVQFHPTALSVNRDAGGARLPLLTEALRGAGAILLDQDRQPLMRHEHPMGDLAPRDVVARAIHRRRVEGQAVFLDLRPALGGRTDEFPQAVAACRAAGLDPFEEPVPVTPAAHYHMGGIVADVDGRTSVPGLWACGEAANTGVHGANRLASNSLIEALVWARRAAAAVRRELVTGTPHRPVADIALSAVCAVPDEAETVKRLRRIMSRHVGIVRDGEGLAAALAELESLEDRQRGEGGATAGDYEQVRRAVELKNMLLAARMIALAALRRTESRGAHCRGDHPVSSTAWARRQTVTVDDLNPPVPRAVPASQK